MLSQIAFTLHQISKAAHVSLSCFHLPTFCIPGSASALDVLQAGFGSGGHLLTISWQCRGDASAAGLLFQGWDAAGEGSAAIVYDWERSVLEAIYEAPPQDMGATQDPDAEEGDGLRRVGGPVEADSGDVHMRILLDHSCVEVYLGTGEVLSTRIYRFALFLSV